ncbi:sulfite exporter TauE/SafE family protein [Marinobacterium jannaschii]|uniref:sulfite exporter TauE/SafE family protein n=1 Tax=Marinobacterium jannaschii TaxID=64970 RepID=UPI00055D90EB|nr:sulfite exporter TauE/SafE family protein [Marinobacterium jannaschii]
MEWLLTVGILEQLGLLLISFIANGLSALAGGGAGLLQLPILIFLGLGFSTALATHKVASVALGVGATLRHIREGSISWRFALFILCSGLPGVVLGAFKVLDFQESFLLIALGCLTAGLGIYSAIKKGLGMDARKLNRDVRGYLLGGTVLFAIGCLNGSLTSGTGLFVTLWLVRWFGLDYKQAVAYTLILVGLFWNGAGAIALVLQVQPVWDWLPALLAGAIIGAYTGAHLGLKQGNVFIKRVFEALTLLVGSKLIYDGISQYLM